MVGRPHCRQANLAWRAPRHVERLLEIQDQRRPAAAERAPQLVVDAATLPRSAGPWACRARPPPPPRSTPSVAGPPEGP
eukprot:15423273-Alexandrium_andersonii.AAC.1